jgi:hypothetical protein
MQWKRDSRRTCSLTFCRIGSPGRISGDPARLSSQFADHDTFIGLPLIRLRGGATGICSPNGAAVRFS